MPLSPGSSPIVSSSHARKRLNHCESQISLHLDFCGIVFEFSQGFRGAGTVDLIRKALSTVFGKCDEVLALGSGQCRRGRLKDQREAQLEALGHMVI